MANFTATDKKEVANYIRDAGFDMTKGFIGDHILQVEKYWKQRKLLPTDEPIPQAVKEYITHPQGNGFLMVMNNGQMHPVGQEVFNMESPYNFLPDRYRTFTPGIQQQPANDQVQNPV